MSKVKKPHDDGSENTTSDISFDLVNETDAVMEELTEFVRQSVVHSRASISGRAELLRLMIQLLNRFSSSVDVSQTQAGDGVSLDGLAERLLTESDGQMIEASLSVIGSAKGEAMLDKHLAQLSFPHYEQNPDDESTFIQTLEDGTKTVGRFVDRVFVAADND